MFAEGQHEGVDLKRFKRAGSAQTLWKEFGTLAKRRNGVVHRCESASRDEGVCSGYM